MTALPNKYVSIDYSTIGLVAIVLERLRSNDTISSLWDRLSSDQRIRTFDRLADAVTLAFAGGLLEFQDGVLLASSPRRGEQ